MPGPWEKYQQAEGPWSKYLPAPEAAPEVGVGEDMLRSAASGLRTGLEGIAGLPKDITTLQGKLTGWLAGKFGASPETQETAREIGSFSPFALMPSSDYLRSLSTKLIGDPYEPQTVPGEYTKTAAEFLPGAAAGPGSLPVRLFTQALIPALGSETAGQLTDGTDAEPYARIIGALAGGLAPSMARRAITPFPASPERQQMARILADEGVDLTAGQRTGSDRLRYMESELGGVTGQQFAERQGEQFTAAALRRAGVDANRASPEVIDDAFNVIGQRFDDLAARNSIVPDQQLVDDFVDVWRSYAGRTSDTTRIPAVRETIEDIVNTARNRGGLSGEYYQATRSKIGRQAQGLSSPEARQALRDVQDVLDDAMERSMQAAGSADMPAWREARQQYRNMLVVEQAATGAGENAAMGIISPSQLRNSTVMKHGRRNYARGQGDFAELARAGEAMMKPLPQSGTAPRQAARNLGIGAASMIGGGTAGVASGGNPAATIAGILAGAAVPAAAGRAMLSGPGRALLGNQMLGPGPEGVNATRAAIIALLAGQNNRAIAP